MDIKLSGYQSAIHENAVKHGFWADGKMDSIDHVTNLIVSEWSEAVQEDRKQLPYHYFLIGPACDEQGCPDEPDGPMICTEGACILGKKPEGVAVEIIDGIIRILDWMEANGYRAADLHYEEPEEENVKKEYTLDALISVLNYYTASAGVQEQIEDQSACLFGALNEAATWLALQGLDVEALIREKMSYNAGRPYLHGKAY